MIAAGYMLKRIVSPPEWLNAPSVDFVYSVSNCVSDDFFDFITLWKHNGWWLFDTPAALNEIVVEQKIEPRGLTLFYYEVFEDEYDDAQSMWIPIAPEPSFETNVIPPDRKILHGYDVVTFYVHTSPECSPLSCNNLAEHHPVNRFCLFNDFESARTFAMGKLDEKGEPGPYRIFAVYTVDLG